MLEEKVTKLEKEIAAKDKIIEKLTSDLSRATAGIGGTYYVIETDEKTGKEYATHIIQVETDGSIAVLAGEKGGVKIKKVRHADEEAEIELFISDF